MFEDDSTKTVAEGHLLSGHPVDVSSVSASSISPCDPCSRTCSSLELCPSMLGNEIDLIATNPAEESVASVHGYDENLFIEDELSSSGYTSKIADTNPDLGSSSRHSCRRSGEHAPTPTAAGLDDPTFIKSSPTDFRSLMVMVPQIMRRAILDATAASSHANSKTEGQLPRFQQLTPILGPNGSGQSVGQLNVGGAIMVADISGFTKLTETLAAKQASGIEILTNCINSYFSHIIEVVHRHVIVLWDEGGDVIKFAGDSIIVLFQATQGNSSGIVRGDIGSSTDGSAGLCSPSGEEVQSQAKQCSERSEDSQSPELQRAVKMALACSKELVHKLGTVQTGSDGSIICKTTNNNDETFSPHVGSCTLLNSGNHEVKDHPMSAVRNLVPRLLMKTLSIGSTKSTSVLSPAGPFEAMASEFLASYPNTDSECNTARATSGRFRRVVTAIQAAVRWRSTHTGQQLHVETGGNDSQILVVSSLRGNVSPTPPLLDPAPVSVAVPQSSKEDLSTMIRGSHHIHQESPLSSLMNSVYMSAMRSDSLSPPSEAVLPASSKRRFNAAAENLSPSFGNNAGTPDSASISEWTRELNLSSILDANHDNEESACFDLSAFGSRIGLVPESEWTLDPAASQAYAEIEEDVLLSEQNAQFQTNQDLLSPSPESGLRVEDYSNLSKQPVELPWLDITNKEKNNVMAMWDGKLISPAAEHVETNLYQHITLSLKILVSVGYVTVLRIGHVGNDGDEETAFASRFEILIGDTWNPSNDKDGNTRLLYQPMRQIAEIEPYAVGGAAIVSWQVAVLAGKSETFYECDRSAEALFLLVPDDLQFSDEDAFDVDQDIKFTHEFIQRLPSGLQNHTTKILRAHIPQSVRRRIEAGLHDLVSEFRVCNVLFIGFPCLTDPTWIARRNYSQAQAIHFAFDAISKTMQKYHGSLLQFRCDEKGYVAIAAFGVPGSSSEDRGAKGVMAAMEVVALVTEVFKTKIPGPKKDDIVPCRIGVTNGMLFCACVGGITRSEYTVFGNAINLAARLMTSAVIGTGPILCDYQTYKLALHRVQFAHLPAIRVKGCSDPVQIFCPTKPKPTNIKRLRRSKYEDHDLHRVDQPERIRSIGPLAVKMGILVNQDTPLVGEAANAVEQIEYRLCRLVDKDPEAPGCIFIEGAAGMGKSRLLAEAGCNHHDRSNTAKDSRTWKNSLHILPGNPCSVENCNEPFWVWRRIFATLFSMDRRLSAEYGGSSSEQPWRLSESFLDSSTITAYSNPSVTLLGNTISSQYQSWNTYWRRIIAAELDCHIDAVPIGLGASHFTSPNIDRTASFSATSDEPSESPIQPKIGSQAAVRSSSSSSDDRLADTQAQGHKLNMLSLSASQQALAYLSPRNIRGISPLPGTVPESEALATTDNDVRWERAPGASEGSPMLSSVLVSLLISFAKEYGATVIVLEDCHYADSSSWELLSATVMNLRREAESHGVDMPCAPLLLIASARPDEGNFGLPDSRTARQWLGPRKSASERSMVIHQKYTQLRSSLLSCPLTSHLQLGALGMDETGELVNKLLCEAVNLSPDTQPDGCQPMEVDRAVVAAIFNKTEGLPAYVQETIAWLRMQIPLRNQMSGSQEALAQAGKGTDRLGPCVMGLMRWLLTVVPMSNVIPELLDRLGMVDQMTVKVAALFGQTSISAFLLTAVHPLELSLEAITSSLNVLMACGILNSHALSEDEAALGSPVSHEVRVVVREKTDWREARLCQDNGHPRDKLSKILCLEDGSMLVVEIPNPFEDHQSQDHAVTDRALQEAAKAAASDAQLAAKAIKTTYSFQSGLIRDTITAGTTFTLRRRLHARVAVALECIQERSRKAGCPQAVGAGNIAYHYHHSIGEVVSQPSLALKAIDWWEKAAADAAHSGAYAEAVRMYTNAYSKAKELQKSIPESANTLHNICDYGIANERYAEWEIAVSRCYIQLQQWQAARITAQNALCILGLPLPHMQQTADNVVRNKNEGVLPVKHQMNRIWRLCAPYCGCLRQQRHEVIRPAESTILNIRQSVDAIEVLINLGADGPALELPKLMEYVSMCTESIERTLAPGDHSMANRLAALKMKMQDLRRKQ